MRDILDVHTHTLASGHAYNTMREMAKAASEKGLEILGITEHAVSMPGTCGAFYFEKSENGGEKYVRCGTAVGGRGKHYGL